MARPPFQTPSHEPAQTSGRLLADGEVAVTKCTIWASADGAEENNQQVIVLRQWARECGLEVAAEFAVHDSESTQPGDGSEGSEYDAARAELVNEARLGRYQVVFIKALGQLSRRDAEDALRVLRQLAEYGVDVRSRQEPWLHIGTPETRELRAGMLAWWDSEIAVRRSAQIKAGLARRKAEGKAVGGRKPGARDRTPRSSDGYATAWADGGKRRKAVERSRPGQAEQSDISAQTRNRQATNNQPTG